MTTPSFFSLATVVATLNELKASAVQTYDVAVEKLPGLVDEANKTLEEAKQKSGEWVGSASESLGEVTKNITEKSGEMLETAKVSVADISQRAPLHIAEWSKWAVDATEEGKIYVSSALGLEDPNARFGVPLEVACARDNSKIPLVVRQCIAILEKPQNIVTPNLFYEEADPSLRKTLMGFYNSEKAGSVELDLDMYSVHSIADLLLTYLKSLPAPIIENDTEHLTELESNNLKLTVLRNFIKNRARVPEQNYNVLIVLSSFCGKLLVHRAQNNLTVNKLSKLFGPVIIKDFDTSKSGDFIMRTLIEAHEEIFEVNDVDADELQAALDR